MAVLPSCAVYGVGYRCCCLPTVTLPPFSWHAAVHKFLVDWRGIYVLPEGLRLCSNSCCGRSETRRQEFRCCSACGEAKYCSRACQALDWKAGHKLVCAMLLATVQRQQQQQRQQRQMQQHLFVHQPYGQIAGQHNHIHGAPENQQHAA
ncbi:unnamed protein product [Closterium sp. NIES-54]